MTNAGTAIRLTRAEDVAEALITMAVDPNDREQILAQCRALIHGEPDTAAMVLALMTLAVVAHYDHEVRVPQGWDPTP